MERLATARVVIDCCLSQILRNGNGKPRLHVAEVVRRRAELDQVFQKLGALTSRAPATAGTSTAAFEPVTNASLSMLPKYCIRSASRVFGRSGSKPAHQREILQPVALAARAAAQISS